jgi:hypothetical protein
MVQATRQKSFITFAPGADPIKLFWIRGSEKEGVRKRERERGSEKEGERKRE